MAYTLTDRTTACSVNVRLGDIDVNLTTGVASLMNEFAELYEGRRVTDHPRHPAIHMEIVAGRNPFRPRYFIRGEGQNMGKGHAYREVLPYLEWGINWRVIDRHREFLQLHAATLTHAGGGILLAGPSGQGKSTLAAAMMARGWTYLCDEFALIDPRTLHVHPFPKALCIKAGSFDVVERLGVPLWRRGHYVKASKGPVAYVRPYQLGLDAKPRPSPIRFIVFPKYARGLVPRMRTVSRGRTAFMLAANAFNRTAHSPNAMSILSDVVRDAVCVSLESGDINQSCDLLESLVAD